jgi:hypothetical protein
MIVILYQDGCEAVATSAVADIAGAFAGQVEAQAIAASAPPAWPGDRSWDDLLVIIYCNDDFPATGSQFVADFIAQRPGTALLLPVATDPAFRKPPGVAAGIKALAYDAAAPGPDGRLVSRAGGMLGLRVQGRDTKIFISYRASDGAGIATQLYEYLTASGHRAYLDEAKEIDGDTAIRPGSDVQKEIDEALKGANLLLLIDTPDAPSSRWIRHEVDTADSLLLPILPICFRKVGDPKQGPRFRSLLELQRWVLCQVPPAPATPPLADNQLAQIVDEAEKYLCEIFRRKCRVPFIVEKEFVSRGFAWKVLDQRLLIFESSKTHSARLHTRVCSHCSVFDQIYMPALRRFCAFLNETGRANWSLFIYDGKELLTEPQLEELAVDEGDVLILHHQELAALIDSNFTMLGAA